MATIARRRISEPALSEGAVIAFALAIAYAGANVIAPLLFYGGWNLYAVQPAIWLGLAYWCLAGRQDAQAPTAALVLGVAAGAFHVAVLILAGLLLGFGHSPYAHGPLALAGNLVYLGAFLAGVEAARWRLLQAYPGASLIALLLVALAFALLDVPFGQWRAVLAGDASTVNLSGQLLLPSAGESWLATVLALAGGPYAAIAYRGLLGASEWLSPILPTLGWTQAALIGAIVPVAAALAVRPAGAEGEAEDDSKRGVPAWLIASGATVLALIWLNTGLLGVQPAVVTGISMEPVLRQGDIVVTRPVAPESLRAGDLIRFQEGGAPVIHRIREVRTSGAGLVFITQGDNNGFADAPVLPEAIDGKVVLTIPKLGLLPLEARKLLGK